MRKERSRMGNLGHFRLLPRQLQALTVLGAVLLLVSMAILASGILHGVTILRALLSDAQAAPSADQTSSFLRWLFAGMALGILGLDCAWPASFYMARLRRFGHAAPSLESWQAQIGVTLALAALPLCSLAVVGLSALSGSPIIAAVAVVVSAALNLLATFALLAAYMVSVVSILSFG